MLVGDCQYCFFPSILRSHGVSGPMPLHHHLLGVSAKQPSIYQGYPEYTLNTKTYQRGQDSRCKWEIANTVFFHQFYVVCQYQCHYTTTYLASVQSSPVSSCLCQLSVN